MKRIFFALAVLVVGLSVAKADPVFYFRNTDGTEITSVSVPLGGRFTFDVWVDTDGGRWNSAGAAVGWGTATAFNSTTDIDGKLRATSIVGMAPFAPQGTNFMGMGLRGPATGNRPFGTFVAAGTVVDPGRDPGVFHIARITLENLSSTATTPGRVAFWTFPGAASFATYIDPSPGSPLTGGSGFRMGPGFDVVPEPASMIALGTGLVGLLGLRRRKR